MTFVVVALARVTYVKLWYRALKTTRVDVLHVPVPPPPLHPTEQCVWSYRSTFSCEGYSLVGYFTDAASIGEDRPRSLIKRHRMVEWDMVDVLGVSGRNLCTIKALSWETEGKSRKCQCTQPVLRPIFVERAPHEREWRWLPLWEPFGERVQRFNVSELIRNLITSDNICRESRRREMRTTNGINACIKNVTRLQLFLLSNWLRVVQTWYSSHLSFPILRTSWQNAFTGQARFTYSYTVSVTRTQHEFDPPSAFCISGQGNKGLAETDEGSRCVIPTEQVRPPVAGSTAIILPSRTVPRCHQAVKPTGHTRTLSSCNNIQSYLM
jgi:hypothetical protein